MQRLPIRHDTEFSTDALWWQPLFAFQREMNGAIRDYYADVIPSTLLELENDIFTFTQRGMHRLFSEFFNNRQMVTPWWTGSHTEPYVDILENGHAFKVRADVPGLCADDLEVAVSDSALTIRGCSKLSCREGGDDTYLRRECHGGSFHRTVALPEEADMSKASASFENNVLMVTIPKKPGVAEAAPAQETPKPATVRKAKTRGSAPRRAPAGAAEAVSEPHAKAA